MSMSVHSYIDAVRARLTADGCAVTTETVDGLSAAVGYKAQFSALSRIHVFTVVASAKRVDEATLRRYTDAVLNLAKDRKGQWRACSPACSPCPPSFPKRPT